MLETTRAGEELSAPQYRNLGFVVVTPNGPSDGGDFGPLTPGTRTAGIQEAVDAATQSFRNLFIAGVQAAGRSREDFLSWDPDKGWLPTGEKRWYYTQETIRIPPTQGFRIDACQTLIMYQGSGGAVLHIDSCMDARYRFGILVQNKRQQHEEDGAVVLVRPERPVPMDGFAVVTDSTFEFSSLSGGGLFDFDTWSIVRKPYGGGLVLDATVAPVLYNRFSVSAILLAERNVYLTGEKCHNNWLQVLHNQQSITHLQLGDEHSQPSCNRIDMSINANQLDGSTGARIFGHSNFLTLDIQKASPGRDIVFEPSARDNIVTVATEFQPLGSSNPARKRGALLERNHLTCTNRAVEPTNRIITARAWGFNVETPPVPPSGEVVTNRNVAPVDIIIVAPGEVSTWSLTDTRGATLHLEHGLRCGQQVTLQPGEVIGLTYVIAPQWRWKAAG